jgi:hypothetical protein
MIQNRPSAMILGCPHWGNPGLDIRQVEYDDMLAPHRQAEIEECLRRLLRFKPTKVALEIETAQMDQVNRDYEAYRTGAFSLTANERHQLGFRIASDMHHTRVFGIDWHDHTREIGWDRAIDFALDHGQAELVEAMMPAVEHTEETKASDAAKAVRLTAIDQLIEYNDPDQGHRIYMDMARIGLDDNYVGADVILRWYERNLKMFVNLSRLLDSPDQRLLVVVGAGHLPLLTHFLEGSARFRVVSALDYLSE